MGVGVGASDAVVICPEVGVGAGGGVPTGCCPAGFADGFVAGCDVPDGFVAGGDVPGFADGSVAAVEDPVSASLLLVVPWPGAIGVLDNWQFISDPSKPQRRTLTIGMSGKRV